MAEYGIPFGEAMAAGVPVMKSQWTMADLYAVAHAAGMKAGNAIIPEPMIVRNGNKVYAPVMDGVCGFAWINIKPAKGKFVAWLKENKMGYKDYTGGWSIWVRDFNQSMTRKEAYAYAFAGVLTDYGFKAYGNSRID